MLAHPDDAAIKSVISTYATGFMRDDLPFKIGDGSIISQHAVTVADL